MLSRQDLVLLGSLYVAQGLPFGLFSQTLPVVLREQGGSLELVGLSGLVALPWAAKFAWAPLVDRFGSARFGRRRSWIVPLQLVSALVLVAVAIVGPADLAWLLGAAAVLNLLAATQDIATDGLAVERIPASERGLGNGVQVAGFRVGMVLGGGVLLLLLDRVGWTWGLLALAGLMIVSSLPIVLHREQSLALMRSHEPGRSITSLLPWLVAVGAYKFGDALAQGMIRPLLVDLGYDLGQIGAMVGIGGFTAGLLGAAAGGMALRRVPRGRALWWFGVAQSAAVAGYAGLAVSGPDAPLVAWACCMLEHFAGGLATVALFTVMMDRCRVGSEGTDYTYQASAVVIASGIAASASGFVAADLGYVAHFSLAAALSLLGALTMTLAQSLPALRGRLRCR